MKLIRTDDVINTDLDRKEIFYYISPPMYLKSKDTLMFSVLRSRGGYDVIDDYLIILKLSNNQWKFVEQFYTQEMH